MNSESLASDSAATPDTGAAPVSSGAAPAVTPRAPGNVECALVTTPAERAAIFAVRMTVFVEEQAVPPEEELDALDAAATHFLLRLSPDEAASQAVVIGTARLLDKGDGRGKVGRVAVLREYRGLGLGLRLMEFIEATARAQGFQTLVLDAQCYAIAFYEKLGYVAEGDVFLDAGIEHRFMQKTLTG